MGETSGRQIGGLMIGFPFSFSAETG